ncbi:MAG: nucleotidyl transferase AbiEii/AbiGii toxin family protein [Candidatus Uhrbacteria bacterium]
MAKSLSITVVAETDLRLDCLPVATRKAFRFFTVDPILAETTWYLAGGTALTLQVGHRKSVDLDFFCPDSSFDELAWERRLLRTGAWDTTKREDGTLYGKMLGAKVSFIAYPFFKPTQKRFACGNVRMLAAEDIAVMKIIAVSQRGRKRDFVDLYWYCRHKEPLADIIRRTIRQYPGQDQNLNHILASLRFFHDAEGDPMPKTEFAVQWSQVKRYFEKEVPQLAKTFYEL